MAQRTIGGSMRGLKVGLLIAVIVAAFAIVIEHLVGHHTGAGWTILNCFIFGAVLNMVRMRVDPPANPSRGRYRWSKERKHSKTKESVR
jgi:hypothetical protein